VPSVADDDVLAVRFNGEALAFEHPHQRVENAQPAPSNGGPEVWLVEEMERVRGGITAPRIFLQPSFDNRMPLPARSKHVRVVGFECLVPEPPVNFWIHRCDPIFQKILHWSDGITDPSQLRAGPPPGGASLQSGWVRSGAGARTSVVTIPRAPHILARDTLRMTRAELTNAYGEAGARRKRIIFVRSLT
jgi:hypothetical protein